MDLDKVLQEFLCDDCSLAFADYKQLFLHRKYHTSLFRRVITEEILLEESCPLCSIKYVNKYKDINLEELLGSGRALKGYGRETKTRQIMRCKYYPKCDAVFYGFYGFVKHARKVHNDDRPYACQQCNYTAKRYRYLKKHLFAHVGYKRSKCPLCVKEFARKENLKAHLLSNHEEVNIKSHDCSYCGKKFAEPNLLRRHLNMHLPTSETIKCQLCSKKFSSKKSLGAHLKGHKGSRDNLNAFICGVCSTRFASEKYLKKHELKHIGKKQFSCDYCDKKFNTSSRHKQHQTIHAGTLQCK